MKESAQIFEQRKVSHIQHSLSDSVQTPHLSDLNRVHLVHEALPDFDFNEIDTRCSFFGYQAQYPLFISSMTAGHKAGTQVNETLARAAESHGWLMGVGSQRRELTDSEAFREWVGLRKVAPRAALLGNIGISQIITSTTDQIRALVEGLEARALIVHLNPLQEVLQLEGTPYFRGGLQALERLCGALPVPVIVKEVGCGISSSTAKRLQSAGVSVIDVAGLGGTHWGRIEGLRAQSSNGTSNLKFQVSETFKNWGLGLIESLLQVKSVADSCQVWASGGVRSGLDAAKLLATGASNVGLAQPILQALMEAGPEGLELKMQQVQLELKIAMFCSGSRTLIDLDRSKVVIWDR